MPSIEEMTSTGNSAAKSATMSNWSRPASLSRKLAITRDTSGSRSSIAFLVNTVRTSLRRRSCSGGSMMIIMLVCMRWRMARTSTVTPYALLNVSQSRCAATTSSYRDRA
jgi:hypothetical protein